MEPRIQYAKTSDGVNIAYAVFGEGTPLVYPPSAYGLGLHQYPELRLSREFVDRLTEQGFQVIRYDDRGAGSSDRDSLDFSIEAMVSDLEAVIERLGQERVVLLGHLNGTFASVAYAARHPERVSHLVLRDPRASLMDILAAYPGWKITQAMRHLATENWELVSLNVAVLGYGFANLELASDLARVFRSGLTPEAWMVADEATESFDVRRLLKSIGIPTLVIIDGSFPGRTPASFSPTKRIAAEIPDAELVTTSDPVSAISQFVFGASISATTARPMAAAGMTAILFADIADSTALTERVGDTAFRSKARELDSSLRKIIGEHDGICIDAKTLGDGVLATFPSAAEAIKAALVCCNAGDEAGLPLHLGLHAGDVIREANNVFGGAVNIASRISALSAPGEVLVSETVRSLARTSAGVSFVDRGEQSLKGVEDPVRVWAVDA